MLSVAADGRSEARFAPSGYDEARRAGPLERLVAPPYDVISPEPSARTTCARSPYNVVHLTLPDDEERGGADLADWRPQGVLVRDEEPGVWVLSQDYIGPDGVAARARASSRRCGPSRTRAASCSRTSARTRAEGGPAAAAARDADAARADLPAPRRRPARAARPRARPRERRRQAVAARRTRRASPNTQLLIADGHHRYETALAFHAEDGGSPWHDGRARLDAARRG